MRITIREASADDYAGIAALYAAADSRRVVQADALRHADAHRDPHLIARRLVALHDDNIVGIGEFAQHAEMHHARRFAVQIAVRPEWQRRGIGSALYERILRALARFEPELLRATVHNSQPRAATFLTNRGFREAMRFVEAELDVAQWHELRNGGGECANGIAITTLAEVMHDARKLRALYDLVCDVRADAPVPDAPTAMTFETFVARTVHHPAALSDAFFIAIADAQCVGCASLLAADDETLYAGLTGVRAAHRRQGIATALKLRAIAFARASGFRRIRTVCAAQNEAMRHLNARLGFAECGGWTGYVKEWDEG